MDEDQHYELCKHYNMGALSMIINVNYINKYMTVASLHQLNDTMVEKFKAVLEPNSLITWPKSIDTYGLIDYIAIGNIPHGAMVLYKLGYRVNHKYPPTRNGSMYMEFYHPDKRSILYDIADDCFTSLWYELLAIEINDH